MKTLLILLLGVLLCPSFFSSPARTGLGSAPSSATASSSQSGDVVLVSNPLEATTEIPEADPGPTPAKEDLCIYPFYEFVVNPMIADGMLGEENPVTWDPDRLVWNHQLERLELGEWYRSWPVLTSQTHLLGDFRGSFNNYGDARLYPSDYDGPCSIEDF